MPLLSQLALVELRLFFRRDQLKGMNTRSVPIELFAISITLAIIGVVMVSPAFSSGCNETESCPVDYVNETYPADTQDSFLLLNPLPASPSDCPSSFEERVILLINVERAYAGLTPLTLDIRLQAAARWMSDDMADRDDPTTHIGSDGSTLGDRILREGYVIAGVGAAENIAGGFQTPESVVAGWMLSPDHEANILTPGFEHLGVGYTYQNMPIYDHYWTVDFGATNDPRDPPLTSCDPGFYQIRFPIVMN